MRIGLVDVDGHHFPNLALMKLSAWHKSQGDMVEFADPMFGHYDRVYMSKVFTFTPDCPDYYPCEVVRAGTGYKDYTTTLPDARACSADGAVVNADGQRCYKFQSSTQSSQAEERSRPRRHDFASVSNWEGFPTESPICGPDDGLSAGLDGITFPAWRRESIKAYGNTIVPQVALRIFETINEYEKQ